MINGIKNRRRNAYGRLGDVSSRYNFGARIISDGQTDGGVLAGFAMLTNTYDVSKF